MCCKENDTSIDQRKAYATDHIETMIFLTILYSTLQINTTIFYDNAKVNC